MKRKKDHALTVGLFVLAGIAILMAMIVSFGELDKFRPYYRVIGTFEDVKGIKDGAPVHMAGVPVGYVERIDFVQEGKRQIVHLEMMIEERYSLKQDTQLTIAERGVLGEKYIDFSIGSIDLDILPKDGSVVMEGRVAPSLSDFTYQGKGLISSIEPVVAQAHEFLGHLNNVVGDDEFQSDVKNAIAKISDATDEAAEAAKSYRLLAEDARRLVANWREISNKGGEKLDETADRIGRVTDQISSILDKTDRKIDGILNKTDRIMEQVSTGQGNFGKFVFEEKMYTDAATTIADFAEVVKMIKDDPTVLLFGPPKKKKKSSSEDADADSKGGATRRR